MVDALRDYFIKYAVFTGRTSRKDFLLTYLGITLIEVLIVVSCTILNSLLGSEMNYFISIYDVIFNLATFIPSIAIVCRRLHDINKSGLWELIIFVPIAGPIILTVFLCLPKEDYNNKY